MLAVLPLRAVPITGLIVVDREDGPPRRTERESIADAHGSWVEPLTSPSRSRLLESRTLGSLRAKAECLNYSTIPEPAHLLRWLGAKRSGVFYAVAILSTLRTVLVRVIAYVPGERCRGVICVDHLIAGAGEAITHDDIVYY